MPKKKKRVQQEINAGSMADIAFLLLIFFLVTTTMDTPVGILRRLPEDVKEGVVDIHERNLISIMINAEDELLLRKEIIQIEDLKESVKSLVLNKKKEPNKPSFKWISRDSIQEQITNLETRIEVLSDKELAKLDRAKKVAQAIDYFGEFKNGERGYFKSQHVISIQNHNSTSYERYITVNNEIARVYRELRESIAETRLKKELKELTIEEKEALEKVILPKVISEAEPIEG